MAAKQAYLASLIRFADIMILRIITTIVTCFVLVQASGQGCPGLGQNPGSAFPVCALDTFTQTEVPICGGSLMQAPGCNNVALYDVNPYYYKFTCFKTGTLSFVIKPKNPGDDYDWQIFDITNQSPTDIYTVPSLFVACNWSGETGNTGASSAGTLLSVCDGLGKPLFSKMPTLIEGHNYVLMVSHFSGDSQSGYDLIFGTDPKATASIFDPKEPALESARAICDGERMTVKLNKKMKCSSLKIDGSDFTITPAFANIIAADGVNCNNSFDMDSIVLTLSGPVPPGNYTLTIKSGNDNINLLDNCDRTIPDGQSLPVVVYPLIPTPMDSLTKPGCAPDVLNLVFSKPMQCNSITPEGSEFTVTGPSPVTVTSASGLNCSADELSNIIQVKLASPLQKGGRYRITLNTGYDGNTIKNECSMETAAGSFIDFLIADTVSAYFSYQINWGCNVDAVSFSHPGGNAVNRWLWNFDNDITSISKDTTINHTVFGTKNATLTVSNGVCTATYSAPPIVLDNDLKAVFEVTSDVCPGDPAVLKESSYNRVVKWNWDFGNGITSTLQSPPNQFYINSNRNKSVPIRLVVENDLGCKDTAINMINVVANCYIAVPKAFTPNNDGLNDYLYPTNAYKARDLRFTVYNRRGQKVFETTNWQNKWDGTFNGMPQDSDTYVWTLVYTHIETGQHFNLKGTTLLLR